MTFQEMINQTTKSNPAPAPEKVEEQPAPPAPVDNPAPVEVKQEQPAPIEEKKEEQEPAPARRYWTIPAYNYTPRDVVAGRNSLSNAANESARARIICEKWKITDHVVFKVDKTRENHIFAYYDDDAIRPGLFAIANHLSNMKLSIEKVEDLAPYRRNSSKPAPAPAEVKPAPAPVKLAPVFPANPHTLFNKALQIARAGVPLYLAGPAGSGKTTLAKQIAAALGLTFNVMSFCGQTSKSDLLGYMDANGKYQTSSFRATFERGGLFLFDEMDAANPNILTVLNSAIANRACSFPDNPEKPVEASPDFVVIAAANTLGRGAKGDYTGRLQLDAATLDRFAVLECEYDENLERKISLNDSWARRVQTIRAAVAVAGERLLISPRASINGARLIAAGMSREDVEECVIWRGVNRDVRDRITARIVNNYQNAAD